MHDSAATFILLISSLTGPGIGKMCNTVRHWHKSET